EVTLPRELNKIIDRQRCLLWREFDRETAAGGDNCSRYKLSDARERATIIQRRIARLDGSNSFREIAHAVCFQKRDCPSANQMIGRIESGLNCIIGCRCLLFPERVKSCQRRIVEILVSQGS